MPKIWEDYEEKNMANTMRKCRHFKAMIRNDSCELDIPYQNFRYEGRGLDLPCFGKDSKIKCDKVNRYTREEAEVEQTETNRAVKKYLSDLAKNTCPHCGKEDITKSQVGRCVYGSCGCRLYQGRLS